MAQQGEIEVFRITPEEGNCYEHIKATRSQYIGEGFVDILVELHLNMLVNILKQYATGMVMADL